MEIKPILDPEFVPAVLWNRAFEQEAENSSVAVTIGLFRDDKVVAKRAVKVLADADRSFKYIERLLKTLLWAVGGNRILFAGPDELFQRLEKHYTESPVGRFDSEIIGEKIYDHAIRVEKELAEDIPEPSAEGKALGRHLDGCRIGFDLGGSDRKCAALIDGEVVFSEEIKWDPYFEKNPQYHVAGIMDSLKRAAEHLPRVDAIGGSAAGVYVNNEVRVASLFRGIAPADFEASVRRIFFNLKERWGNVPFEVVNDGEVTALAGSISMNENAVLGLSMGTSQAVGYVTPEGNITASLNELAFAPVDYREDAPADEWSGDRGCGAQYFSQQAVARLAPLASLDFPAGMPFPERLVEVQKLMAAGDERAAKIYSTIGTYLGYAIAHYAEFYEIHNVLLLGRVTSGKGGYLIIQKANVVLFRCFQSLEKRIKIVTPNEKDKRHGQAVAAASLPLISR
jgi:predicted NBD/HSP70 family sugar kinase